MEIELVKLLRNDDGIKYLKEHSKVFEEKMNRFFKTAAKYVDVTKVNVGDPHSETGLINFESYYNGSKKVVISYLSKPVNRDLDCQFKEFGWIEFSLDKEGNLVINESSGRIESKYGYNFENTDGGVLKTSYSYQEFTPEGIELVYRGYQDQMKLRSSKEVAKDKSREVTFDDVFHNLRASIKSGYNPGLAAFDGKTVRDNLLAKRPMLIEFSRSLDNLGLVKEFHCTFNNQMRATDKREKYHLNRCTKANPYLMSTTYDLPPLAYREGNNNLVVNYPNEGLTSRNYRRVAKDIYIKTLREKINELQENNGLQEGVRNNLLGKYMELYHIYYPDEEIKTDHKSGK